MSFLKNLFGAGEWLKDAEAAINRGDYATALRLIRPLADKGDAQAQFMLGDLYLNGDGVSKDAAQAVNWFRKAAEKGNPKAQTNLAACLDNGWGVQQDSGEAASWLCKAAEKGEPSAQDYLGILYFKGKGVQRDYIQAYKWHSLAVAGWSVSQSLAAAGSASENELRSLSLKHRSRVAAEMTSAQIAEADRLTREWKQVA